MNPLAQLAQVTAMAQSGALTPRCAVCIADLAPESPTTDASPAASVFQGTLLCRPHITQAIPPAQEATA